MKTILKITFLILLLIFTNNFSQIDDSWKVYDDTEVAIIKITMAANDLQYMYDNPGKENDSLHLATVHFKNSQIDEVIDSVGIRIRGNTSRISNKKSFKLSFNTFRQGGKFHSLEKLNLNGEHNDPSIARSKISWDLFNGFNLVSSRSAHAAVYINDIYYGLYISVEHIDENFVEKNYNDDSGNLWKCLYGADLNYIDNNPNIYKFGGADRAYDLKTNEDLDDYSDLANFIDFLNNSSDQSFRETLSQKINLSGLLQVFAINIVTGMWDDYWANNNNFYLYHEPSNDKFHIIPYDYDNTFGINWVGIDWAYVNPYTFAKLTNGPRPLIERTLEFPEFHNLYTRILEFYNSNRFNTSLAGNKINDLHNKIRTWAEEDTYRIMDYGFSFEQFNDSYFKSDFSFFHVNYSINEFINRRFESLNSQLFYKDANPIIYDYEVFPRFRNNEDPITISCSAYSNAGIKSIQAEFINLSTSDSINYNMVFTPNSQSLDIRLRDNWELHVSDLPSSFSGILQFIIEDNNGVIVRYPQNAIEIRSPGEVTNEVLLSELMSLNTSTIQDGALEFDDWLEIYNPQDTTVSLTGKYLTDKIDNLRKWQFPENVSIKSKQSILIWCDEDQEQSGPHINFKLSSNGEFLAIVDNDGITIVDSVTFPMLNENESYARENDTGNWFITSSSTPGLSNTLTDLSDSQISHVYKFRIEAYPNPFNPTTNIEYEIARDMHVEFNIYDILGRNVWTSKKNWKNKGIYNFKWNGTSFSGHKLVSGIYFLHMKGESYNKTLKLMLMR